VEQVISRGDEGSSLLAKLTAPTLKNCNYVDVINGGMNGLAVLKNLPKDSVVVVYSLCGDPHLTDLKNYISSMFSKIAGVAKENNLEPLAIADVVDASAGEKEDIKLIGNVLRENANKHNISILNGELAILGNRVNGVANINSTVIALGKKNMFYNDSFTSGTRATLNYKKNTIEAAVFNHQGKPIWINSDGIGTKTEFYERLGNYELGLLDSLAMKLDDTIKLGATAMVTSDIVEYNNDSFPIEKFYEFARLFSNQFNMQYMLQMERADNRIRGFSIDAPAYNVSGSTVSIIDEEKLKNPPVPNEGDYLIAVRGKPNPRSNGITDKRKIMIRLFGEEYHKTREGQLFLEYLASPSIVLYPYFKELIDDNVATSVFHMSGGAYNGKLARPLVKQNLFVDIGARQDRKDKSLVNIENLFPPDWRELALGGAAFTSAQTAYAKWPMGNDGFITTENPQAAINYLRNNGLEARVVGIIEKPLDGKTGVELTAFNGEKIYYSGK
jgi:phosphoribosylaminoimidazole (AIR) synthetase